MIYEAIFIEAETTEANIAILPIFHCNELVPQDTQEFPSSFFLQPQSTSQDNFMNCESKKLLIPVAALPNDDTQAALNGVARNGRRCFMSPINAIHSFLSTNSDDEETFYSQTSTMKKGDIRKVFHP